MNNFATERKTIAPAGDWPEGFRSARDELIPGYQLEERIGAGGFGEVWRAVAPGGLHKAVKVVYGSMTERHAASELKALERVKSVRHPFILTLERIEVVDSRLIVVCELAECSLREYFDKLTEAGHTGIPRGELLRFLHDAADALDYMSTQHSLQHLDIKPENLLLIGDHVKVADFGLTKDLRDASLSAVAGMTPAYTAPEVFSGNPGPYSDQYSLACVYQLLLTGRPPFEGRTTAQLLSQHLHSPPDISSLPTHDQSVVLRALSKKPQRRFESAKAFIQALKQAGDVKGKGHGAQLGGLGSASGGGLAESTRPSDSETISGRRHDTTKLEDRCLKHLGPLSPEDLRSVMRPTLVIGLGGMGGAVLQSLKERMTERFPEDSTPAFRLLAIDTDEQVLLKRMYETQTVGLTRAETLPVPLKPSSAYHRRFRSLVEWIARRWLFNIPRSRRTEGIRALGRLAFLDHYRDVERTLRQTLTDVTFDDAVTRTAATAGMEYNVNAPRVFVVSSTSGGTGSGMIFDLGYVVRHILREMGLPDEGVTGVLLHDVRSTINRGEIFTANALACIRELNYYCRAQRFTGDDSLSIPPVEMARPFETAYLAPIGRPTGGSIARGPVEIVAEYLFQSFAGSCTGALDHLRATAAPGGLMPKVKSFAAAILTASRRTAQLETLAPVCPSAGESTLDESAEETSAETPAPLECQPADEPSHEPPADIDARIERINSYLQEVETGGPVETQPETNQPQTDNEQLEDVAEEARSVSPVSSVDDASDSPPPPDDPETAAAAKSETPREEGTEECLFSTTALFEQLFKTRGNARLLLAADDEAAADLEPAVDGPSNEQYTHLPDDGETAFVCFEVDGIPLCDVTALIERESPECGELADQLATRTDIDWSS